MKMLVDLFSTDYGLMSLGVILFMLGMSVWFTYLFLGKIRLGEDPTKDPNYAGNKNGAK